VPAVHQGGALSRHGGAAQSPERRVVVGSSQERPWKQASRCAQTAGDKGLELLSQAAAKGVEIQVETG
jgi:hypothetical protein